MKVKWFILLVLLSIFLLILYEANTFSVITFSLISTSKRLFSSKANSTHGKLDANSAAGSLQPRKGVSPSPVGVLIVPNIVHYIWFGKNNPMRFHHFLSVLSAARNLKPDKIYFHCNHEPTGKWWHTLKKNISSLLEITHREPPTSIYGKRVTAVENQSDIARIDILIENGGIYFDMDVIALKSFDDLRKYNCTMGIEYHGNPGRLNDGTIVAVKNATFLNIWRRTYTNFSQYEWDVHSCQIPYYLQYHYPQHIHVEEKSLNYPDGYKPHLIYKTVYDWSKNYAMHLWYRGYKIEHNPNDIKTLNTTFGQMARLTYYGSPDIIK